MSITGYLDTMNRARRLARYEGISLFGFVWACVRFYLEWWDGVTEVHDE